MASHFLIERAKIQAKQALLCNVEPFFKQFSNKYQLIVHSKLFRHLDER